MLIAVTQIKATLYKTTSKAASNSDHWPYYYPKLLFIWEISFIKAGKCSFLPFTNSQVRFLMNAVHKFSEVVACQVNYLL